MIKTQQGFQAISPTFAENCVINQTPNGEIYFLGPDYISSSYFFKHKMEDLPPTTNANTGGGGGLFGGGVGGGLFGGAGAGGGQGGGLFGGAGGGAQGGTLFGGARPKGVAIRNF